MRAAAVRVMWLGVALVAGCAVGNPFDSAVLEERCDVTGDEDGDGLADCEDSDCAGAPACREDVWAWCEDGLDNDLDGATDCDDAGCRDLPPCQEACEGGADDDRDGLVDCADPDCDGAPACAEDCTDGVDNADADSLADCADPECVGTSPCLERCGSGADEDLDGSTDCEDSDCLRHVPCLAARPLRRDEPCEPTRPALVLADAFEDGISAERWSAFSTGGEDAPSAPAEGGAVDLGGRDGQGVSGLASRQAFGVGANQPFDLTVRWRPDGVCGDLSASGCQARIELHTRDVWDDADAVSGVSILAVELGYASRWSAEQPGVIGSELTGTCEYHAEQVPSRIAGTPISEGNLVEVRLSMSEDGRVVVGVLGRPACELGPLLTLEPEGRLVLATAQAAVPEAPVGAQPGRLWLEEVDLRVQPEAPSAACRGLRRSLFPDRFCTADSLYDAGLSHPRVIRTAEPDGPLLMLVRSRHRRTHGHVLAGTAEDPGGPWVLGLPDPPVADGGQAWDDVSLGAAALVAPDRMWAWARTGPDDDARSRIVRADPALPRTWWPGEELLLDGQPGPWRPEAVAVDAAGSALLGWYSGEHDGVPALRWATSSDGVRWSSQRQPALVGVPGQWDAEGVGEPAVTWLPGEPRVLALAYTSQRYGAPPAVGLAYSPDGRTWTRHEANPLVVGQTAGLDLDGVRAGALLADADRLRLFYTAETVGLHPCPPAGVPSPVRRRIAATDLLPVAP